MYQQQKNKFDMPFCGLTKKLKPTGNRSPKYEFSADSSKVKYICSLTKRKYTLSQITEWFMSPEVQKYHNAGYVLKEMAKTEEIQNPHQYDKGTDQLVYTIMMVKPFKPQANIDGMKPIGQAMPQYREIPMTEAQPSAPEKAVPVQKMDDMDDEIPF
tara:strand:- start:1379 stop:1849 length:471 start_codon:yes stop_codon:yes gene_type:complete